MASSQKLNDELAHSLSVKMEGKETFFPCIFILQNLNAPLWKQREWDRGKSLCSSVQVPSLQFCSSLPSPSFLPYARGLFSKQYSQPIQN